MPIFSKAYFTAFEAPPVPSISARSIVLSRKGFRALRKPMWSVLCPISLPSLTTIVFTAPISNASLLNESKNGKIDCLYGMVTLSPEIVFFFINSVKR